MKLLWFESSTGRLAVLNLVLRPLPANHPAGLQDGTCMETLNRPVMLRDLLY